MRFTAGCLLEGCHSPDHLCSCPVLGVESASDGFAFGKLVGVCGLVGEGKKGKVGGKAGVIAGLLLTEMAVGGYNDGECWVGSGCSSEGYLL